MGVHSGRFGVVDGVSTVRDWSVNDEHTAGQGIASNTEFAPARRKAVQDWTGNYGCFGDRPPVMPGETLEFVGYTAPNDDDSGVGERYSGEALVSQIAMNMNFATGEFISFTSEFAGNGALAASQAAQVTDGTDPDIKPSAGCKLQYSTDGITWVDWEDLVSAVLTITNSLQQFVNSGTYDSGTGKLWTGRRRGNLDWTLAVVEQNVDRSRFSKGDQLWIRIMTDTTYTRYWELKTGLVKNFTGIQVNRETAAIIQQTVNVEMNAILVEDASLGHILLPDSTQYWP